MTPLFKKIRVKKNNQNNYEFYLNLTSNTASNVWISVKGNFLIKTSEVFLMFYKLIYSRFIGLLESFNPKNKQLFKGSKEILKVGIEFIQSEQPRYLNPADKFIYNFDKMQYFVELLYFTFIFVTYFKDVLICRGALKKLSGKIKIMTKILQKITS